MPGFLVVLGIIAAVPLVSAAVGQLGFTAAGVAAGSIAAGIQSVVHGAFTGASFLSFNPLERR
ncbi:hypothetical protein CPC08DRAFT_711423 [Agrocybe pediades]|nr:hypothetical protein CPC08DRAFT_711423 [Agrocybe pediades]